MVIADELKIRYIGGPTALFEIGGLKFLTDPTFDPKGSVYTTSLYELHKLDEPAVKASQLGKIDFVLLSHDHHFDNLDIAGRELLKDTELVITTLDGAARLGANAVGLENWQTIDILTKDNRIITITGTPCRHGPVNGDRGPVTGFVINYKNSQSGGVYITGDTVWYEGVEEVSKRFDIKVVVAFFGAAVVKNVGAAHLTMTVEEGIELAKHFKNADIVPLHFEGWGHFTESRKEIETMFQIKGMANRLKWAE